MPLFLCLQVQDAKFLKLVITPQVQKFKDTHIFLIYFITF